MKYPSSQLKERVTQIKETEGKQYNVIGKRNNLHDYLKTNNKTKCRVRGWRRHKR